MPRSRTPRQSAVPNGEWCVPSNFPPLFGRVDPCWVAGHDRSGAYFRAVRTARIRVGRGRQFPGRPPTLPTVDLRDSERDAAFRAELREWLGATLPALPAPPAPGDWDAKRVFDTD